MFRKIAAFAASLLVFCLVMFAGATPASANVEPEQAPVCTYHTETKRPIEVPCAQPYGATPVGIQMNSGEFCPIGSYVTADLNWCLTVETITGGWSTFDDGTVNESEIDFSYLSQGFSPPVPQGSTTPGCATGMIETVGGGCHPANFMPEDLVGTMFDLNQSRIDDTSALEQRVSNQTAHIGVLTGLLFVALVVVYLATRPPKPLQPYKK